mmetsp:Transcript_102097/g.255846  ORF Transcript_102097/g.255846 Transcript_102097/m.255846 type:complete len:234 (+) Transcript_102097:1043-1744(+)
MQAVQEEGQKLLGIMLLVASKLWRKLVDRALEIPRRQSRSTASPEVVDDQAKLLSKPALATCTLFVDVLGVLCREEVLPHQRRVGHALDCCIEEACVPQVLQSRCTTHRRRSLCWRRSRGAAAGCLSGRVCVQWRQAVRGCGDPLVAFVDRGVVVDLHLRRCRRVVPLDDVDDRPTHPLVRDTTLRLNPVPHLEMPLEFTVRQRGRTVGALRPCVLGGRQRVARPLVRNILGL